MANFQGNWRTSKEIGDHLNSNFYKYFQSLTGLSASELEKLTADLPSREVKKGDYLLKSGEICQHTFFVDKGLLRMYSVNEDGKESIVQFAPENWMMSDRGSVYFNEPSAYFIDAIEDTKVVLIDSDFIQKISAVSAEFRVNNERILQNHVRHLQNRISLLIGANAETRYLDFIKLYPDLMFRLPQWMVASYLGITPESLSRVRRDLAKRNFKG